MCASLLKFHVNRDKVASGTLGYVNDVSSWHLWLCSNVYGCSFSCVKKDITVVCFIDSPFVLNIVHNNVVCNARYLLRLLL
jgi:hypothetical protein